MNVDELELDLNEDQSSSFYAKNITRHVMFAAVSLKAQMPIVSFESLNAASTYVVRPSQNVQVPFRYDVIHVMSSSAGANVRTQDRGHIKAGLSY